MRRVLLIGALALALVAAGVLVARALRAPAPPPNPTTGLIVAVGPDTITVRADAGTWTFVVADPTVPHAHLEEHRRDRLPVRVTYERRGERLVATEIADA